MEEYRSKSRRDGTKATHRNRDRDSRREREEKSVDENHRDKEKHKSKRREHESTRSRDHERARHKSSSREKDRDDGKVEKDREREKEKARDRAREKEIERERKIYELERDSRRERKEKEKRRDVDRSRSSDDDDKERERKRQRREDDHQRREVEQGSKNHRHKDGSQEISWKKVDGDSENKKEMSREENFAEEQKRLDDEMEKRRKRVLEWQESRRKKEESENGKLGVPVTREHESGKTWTLDGESDEAMDEDENEYGVVTMSIDNDNVVKPILHNGGDHTVEEEEIDPLDAFMNSVVLPEVDKLNSSTPHVANDSGPDLIVRNENLDSVLSKKGTSKSTGRFIPGENSDSDYEDLDNDGNLLEDENDEEFMKRVKKTKVEKLVIVDHTKIQYPLFRKNFYIESKEISRMTSEEVASYRKQLELKIHGIDVPKPVKTWHQTGLSTKVLDIIKKCDFEKPMSVQAQALPIIMSGRDCIGIAKTGSGKTLAFVLPMLRHIKDQPALMSGDGPIGLILAPTRELVRQIHSDIKKFTKAMGISCVPVYGGSGVAQQISDLKRGAEIVVCTPGRMIDVLCTSSGKITNLRRVTYLVMDEADRMFDMGFEPQITRIVQNTRPDRQTVLFSATFPHQVEILARKVLIKPIKIQVGGRSVVNKDITQLVEVRPECDRSFRLLELLGEWCEKGKILIFVHSQDKCDSLFKDLNRFGYPCLSLHGAKDQMDRESTISDFKSNACNVLIATSIAARGLDVKDLELVINYDVPNHYEDYVHRVGRTGRAGKKGCAITFVSEEDSRYAPDLVKALELSEQSVPDDLRALANGFMMKVSQGQEQHHGTGYGGSGFKFNEEEDEVRKAAQKAQAKEYGFVEDKSDSDNEDDVIRKAGGDISHQVNVVSIPNSDGAARAVALAAALNLQHKLAKIQADALPEHYEAELEINEFPQNVRWKITHKETLGPISDASGAAITTRGQYYPPGRIVGQGERKLYLFIEGATEVSVRNAKVELKRVLEDITKQGYSLPGSAQPGRYSVV